MACPYSSWRGMIGELGCRSHVVRASRPQSRGHSFAPLRTGSARARGAGRLHDDRADGCAAKAALLGSNPRIWRSKLASFWVRFSFVFRHAPCIFSNILASIVFFCVFSRCTAVPNANRFRALPPSAAHPPGRTDASRENSLFRLGAHICHSDRRRWERQAGTRPWKAPNGDGADLASRMFPTGPDLRCNLISPL